MRKFKVYSVLSLICALLLPVFTIINCVFDYYDIDNYFRIININSCFINIFYIKTEEVYIYWKVIETIILIIKLIIFTILPLLSYFYKRKGLYIIQVILLFLDFFSCALPLDGFIAILNISYHALLVVLLGNVIKRIDDLEYY